MRIGVIGVGNDGGGRVMKAFDPTGSARLLEPPAMLWLHVAYLWGLGPNFALTMLPR
jgi:hypothetical protein